MNALLQGWRKILFASFLISAACAAWSEDLDRPVLLVAQPDLQGLYSGTALLVVPALRLFDDLFVTGNGAAVDQIIEQTPNDARYFTGFVGWQAGELAKELEAGYWYVTDPDAALLFTDETGKMWEQLLKRVGKQVSPGTSAI